MYEKAELLDIGRQQSSLRDGLVLKIVSPDPLKTIVDFYKEGMSERGWTIPPQRFVSEDLYSGAFKKGNLRFKLQVMRITSLEKDCLVNHLFCSYSETYKDVVVKVMTGPDLADKYFKVWEPEYVKNYDSRIPKELRRQRFRKSIPYGYIQDSGVLILRIEEGLLVDSNDDALKKFNAR